jgi:hypothetical protein
VPEFRRVLLDLAKKCQVNPKTASQGWINPAMSKGALQQGIEALKRGDEAGYQEVKKTTRRRLRNVKKSSMKL